MLVAEIHHKGFEEARNHEDYLTSTVFGHLRYLPPSIFWPELFRLAKGLPSENGTEKDLAETIAQSERQVNGFSELRAHFWPNHPVWGEPDLLLLFSGKDICPILVLIEAKLWAPKSGTGKWDQLARYLRLLDDVLPLRLELPLNASRYVVYLTPRDSLSEVEESAVEAGNRPEDRQRLFRLRWQDIVRVAKESARQAAEPYKTILLDVMQFLQRLGLEYFDGFRCIEALPDIEVERLAITDSVRQFRGFSELTDVPNIAVQRGEWVS
jgi:hypothetical protein